VEGLKKEDFEECRGLYEKMMKLFSGVDSEVGKLREMFDVVRNLNLRRQYESQVKVAWKSGLFGDDGLESEADEGLQQSE